MNRGPKIFIELIFEAFTNKTYFKIYGLDSNRGKVHVMTAIIYYGETYCNLRGMLTCNGCRPFKQCFSCTIGSRYQFDMVLEAADGTIIGKISDIGSLFSMFIGPQTIAFAGDVYTGRSGPDKEAACPCFSFISRSEHAVFNQADEKIYTTICRCNIMDMIFGCCKGMLCDAILLEMYRPADSSKAFTLIEKCNFHRVLLPIFCIERVIEYEIDKCGSDYPNGMFPIVHTCLGVAVRAHFYTMLRNVEYAPLRSVIGGHVNPVS